MGYPKWLKDLSEQGFVELHEFNVITDDIGNLPDVQNANFIYHMASIASPVFYRKYPIETLDANIWGLRRLLDFYCDNGGYMVLEPQVMDYIEGDKTTFEREPLERLSAEGQLQAYKYNGFWQCMDTMRDKMQLEEMLEQGKAPWKVWDK